jgi:hypothetical protein
LTTTTRAKKGEKMLGDIFDNPWFWFTVVAVLVVAIWVGVYKFYKATPYKTDQSKSYKAIQDPHDGEGWTPTGRIDFWSSPSTDDFILQAEDTRIIEGTGGLEHREIRWRKATLDEAKTVVVSYHTQRNLTMTANLIVNSQRKSYLDNANDKDQLGKKDEPPK